MKEEKKKIQNNFIVAAGLLALFILYTVAIMFVDVQPIGPQGSSVGFAEVNQYFHTLFGVNMLLYSITDWLSIAVLFIMFGFAMVGLVQLIKRKSLFRVDSSILVLGGFYVLVFLAYLFFEFFVVNYRPVLIEGVLEASYPSSTTMLMVVVGIYAVLIQDIGTAEDISGAIWGCMGYTVLLCFCLFKTGSISKAVFTAH